MSGQSSTHPSKTTFFIMRHGMAELNASNDTLRKLNDFGKQQVIDSAAWFKEQNNISRIDIAFVSPYVRAQQTFDIFKRNLMITQYIECDMITPDAKASVFHDYLLSISQDQDCEKGHQSILIVSHMPFVSLFLGELLYSGCADIFNTGALAVVECDKHNLKGELVHHYQSLL